MYVKVTGKAIDDGIPADPEHCPIALAIKDVTHPLMWVAVGKHIVHVGTDSYLLPQHATDWIREFDYDEAGIPFSFKMRKISDRTAQRVIDERGGN